MSDHVFFAPWAKIVILPLCPSLLSLFHRPFELLPFRMGAILGLELLLFEAYRPDPPAGSSEGLKNRNPKEASSLVQPRWCRSGSTSRSRAWSDIRRRRARRTTSSGPADLRAWEVGAGSDGSTPGTSLGKGWEDLGSYGDWGS